MPIARLKRYLDKNTVRYQVLRHSPAYSAQEVAAKAHVSGWELAKTVIVKLDGMFAMAVLPASEQIDFEFFEEVTGAREIHLAEEDELLDLFPGCDLGAMPPFGNLYNMKVYVAPELAEDEHISFSAGSHTEIIRMAYEDFERLVEPEMLPFAVMR